VAAGTGAWLTVLAEDGYLARAVLLAAALAALALSAGMLLRAPLAIPVAIALLAAPYVAILELEADGVDTPAPVLAGALFLAAELAYWSLELRSGIADEPGTYLRRTAVLAGLVLLTVALGTGVLVLVEVVATRGTAVDVVGVVAAVGAIALLALASRRTGA
jgi:hypothetical protein